MSYLVFHCRACISGGLGLGIIEQMPLHEVVFGSGSGAVSKKTNESRLWPSSTKPVIVVQFTMFQNLPDYFVQSTMFKSHTWFFWEFVQEMKRWKAASLTFPPRPSKACCWQSRCTECTWARFFFLSFQRYHGLIYLRSSSYHKIKPLVAAALYLWTIQTHISSSL